MKLLALVDSLAKLIVAGMCESCVVVLAVMVLMRLGVLATLVGIEA